MSMMTFHRPQADTQHDWLSLGVVATAAISGLVGLLPYLVR